jgi:hypothetical protein
MGLDAVVFKNVKALEKVYGTGKFELDAATGEPQPTVQSNLNLTLDDLCAVQARLGNVAEIGQLQNLVSKVLGDADSILMKQILYSGSHSGDAIGVECIPQLRAEIGRLKAAKESELLEFIEKMTVLCAAMESEQNPLVFT